MHGGIDSDDVIEAMADALGEPGGRWVSLHAASAEVVARIKQRMRNARPATEQRPAAPLNATTGGIVAERKGSVG